MKSKYTQELLDKFPKNLAFVDNINDPLNIIIDTGGHMLSELNREGSRRADSLFVDLGDPLEASGIYYISVEDIDRIQLLESNNAEVVDSETLLMRDDVTGFSYLDDIYPSGLPESSGILGISYGFDWDDPKYYVTCSGVEYVYAYDDFSSTPSGINYSVVSQNYATRSVDEHINFVFEIAGENSTLPSGILPTDVVKVAYLEHEPSDNLKIVDIMNLSEPTNTESDGIVVNSNDYVVTGNRVMFTRTRSDYNPATLIDHGDGVYEYSYPANYQPDRAFDSVFVVEYDYRVNGCPRYLTQRSNLHNLGVKSNPDASYEILET